MVSMEYNNAELDNEFHLCNTGGRGRKLSIALELDLESIISKVFNFGQVMSLIQASIPPSIK